ncbi:type II secretion system protein GspM [Pseudohongiella sp. SYSU M77423]|uniref:type II secretion system protein GspM n=1 Tax=Pseudohongiella sp. SYSU M77423 TaxID=3042312 RepID=UPI00248157E5|nr:type II secretion system protein GspM [Pseudohongiella sp. SYSU M77423]MDH7942699.1 type II secretion system protein GspM [Pseudohongiella sp. SYSU M77423]
MSLKRRMQIAGDSFDRRPAAEKTILAVLGIAVISWLYLILVFEPLSTAREEAARQLMATEGRLATMQQRERTAVIMGDEDPNEAVRVRIERAMESQQRLQQQIESLAGNLVTPQSMTRLLTSMLESREGLELIRVENQMPIPMRENLAQAAQPDNSAAPQDTDRLQVYKHVLRLELEGDYLSLISYLRSVEAFSERFFWDELHFEQTAWPNARVTLQLHTLSAEEGFVGV